MKSHLSLIKYHLHLHILIHLSFILFYFQPKTRPATVFPSRYASLPSSTQKPIENDQQQPGNIYIGRDFIGIRINDVHNAVLKSGARMPGKFLLMLFCEIYCESLYFYMLNILPAEREHLWEVMIEFYGWTV